MSKKMKIDCHGDPVTIEVTGNGDVVFHGWDQETEQASVELGFEPSMCFIAWSYINNRSPLNSLSYFVYQGNEDAVNALLFFGIIYPRDGGEALVEAANLGMTRTVASLIKAGADVNFGDSNALILACINGRAEIVKMLLSAGAYANASTFRHGKGTPLIVTLTAVNQKAYNGYSDIVKTLIRYGADVSVDENLPIRLASRNGLYKAVKILLAHGADPSARKYESLISASEIGSHDIVEAIIRHGDVENMPINHALYVASASGNIKTIKLLLKYGANATANDSHAFRAASRNGWYDVVNMLLKAGANVRAEDDYALRSASQNGHTDIVSILLEAGADIHALNDAALQWASSNGHTDVVKILKAWIEEHG